MNEECETCIKRKTMYCPNSIKCMATDDKPYYRNKIMLLEENQELKKQNEFLMKQDNILQTLIQWLYKQIEELENIPKDEEMSIEAYGRLNAYRIVLMKIKELKEKMK